MSRPERIKIIDETGRLKTLTSTISGLMKIKGGGPVLFLGLGPEPEQAFSLVKDRKVLGYLECPDFLRQMPGGYRNRIPGEWQSLDRASAEQAVEKGAEVWGYGPGLKFFPEFWASLWAQAKIGLVSSTKMESFRKAGKYRSLNNSEDIVILPAGANRLVLSEIEEALTSLGMGVVFFQYSEGRSEAENLNELSAILKNIKVKLFLSINFQGLDSYGLARAILKKAGVPVAVWCVDNPFNLISGIKANYWKDLFIFVTDHFFEPLLKRYGALKTSHLPLAGAEHFFAPPDEQVDLKISKRLVFVGRGDFPDKNRFFAGLKLSDIFMNEAEEMLQEGERPDFAWWAEKLALKSFWPEKDVRLASLGANECNRAWRQLALAEAAKSIPLTIFGDAKLAPSSGQDVECRAVVDYYCGLREVYAQAELNLALAGFLLPAGLTQRHFDVWAAGGLLLFDKSPGLNIFPEELVRPVSFSKPSDLPKAAKQLLKKPDLVRDLCSAWKKEIWEKHRYIHRLSKIFKILF